MLDILWILVNFGISNGIVHSSLSYSFWQKMNICPRPTLFRCVMCMGFWTPIPLTITWHSPTGFILWDMFLGSATAWILYLFIMDKQDKT